MEEEEEVCLLCKIIMVKSISSFAGGDSVVVPGKARDSEPSQADPAWAGSRWPQGSSCPATILPGKQLLGRPALALTSVMASIPHPESHPARVLCIPQRQAGRCKDPHPRKRAITSQGSRDGGEPSPEVNTMEGRDWTREPLRDGSRTPGAATASGFSE